MILSVDRLKHWSSLAATAVLPHDLRVKARLALLGRLQRTMLERADVLLIRHPKTGGTWLRAMLTHLYAARDGISTKRVFKSDELNLQNAKLPRYLITNGYASWERLVANAFASNDPVLAGKKTIFLARHPGDIVVSWHRQYLKRTKPFKRELLEYEMGTQVDWPNMDRWTFIQRPELGLASLFEYQNFWVEQLRGRDDALIIRYEDLRYDTEVELGRIVAFLGEAFTTQQIRDAVAFGSVDNMRTLEHSGYFQNSSLRLRNAADPDTFKVRRAKPGGYRDDLTPEQAAWIDEQVRAHSHPALGYGDDGAAASSGT
jgi:hypothetical protein